MRDRPTRTGILGGTFDPIHIGHLIVAREMAEALPLDRVVWIPAAQPPHKAGDAVSTSGHRGAMLERAIADEPGFEIDLRETERAGPSYTFDTLTELNAERPGDSLFFLIGADSLSQLHTWYRAAELPGLAQFATAVRPGFPVEELDRLRDLIPDEQVMKIRQHCVETTPIGVSATQIRGRVACGQSIRHLVPPSVRDYVLEHELYSGATSGRDCG